MGSLLSPNDGRFNPKVFNRIMCFNIVPESMLSLQKHGMVILSWIYAETKRKYSKMDFDEPNYWSDQVSIGNHWNLDKLKSINFVYRYYNDSSFRTYEDKLHLDYLDRAYGLY